MKCVTNDPLRYSLFWKTVVCWRKIFLINLIDYYISLSTIYRAKRFSFFAFSKSKFRYIHDRGARLFSFTFDGTCQCTNTGCDSDLSVSVHTETAKSACARKKPRCDKLEHPSVSRKRVFARLPVGIQEWRDRWSTNKSRNRRCPLSSLTYHESTNLFDHCAQDPIR